MEVEREKKEKLASARRKLNEYKLIRSGAGGRSSHSPVSSSQPADVPSFYQNINAPATSFSIFNPAAVNNNVASPLFVPVTSSAKPVTPQEISSNFADPIPHQNVNFFPNQDQVSTASIHQAENVQFNPFAPPPTVTQQTLETSDLSEKLQTDNITFQQSSTPPILPPVSSEAQIGVIERGQSSELFQKQEQNTVVFDNIQSAEADTSADFSANSLQANEVPIVTPSNDFLPTAPILDAVTGINENSEQPILIDTPTVKEELNQSSNIENHHSNVFNETAQPDNVLNMSTLSQNESTQESNATQSSPVFASSLFGASNNHLDTIFSISDSLQPSLIPSKETDPPAYNTMFTEQKENLNPFTESINDSNEASALFFTPENNLISDSNAAVGASIEKAEAPFIETPFESNIQSTSPTEAQDQKHFFEANTDKVTSLPNDQLSPSTNEEANSIQHEHLLQTDAVNDLINKSNETIYQMRSVQEALELQIEELRRENTYLLNRQTELTTKIEESERLAHEFKLEKDRVREEAATTSQALRARINSLCEENQRIVKNSTDVGVDLRAKLEEKSKQLEEMQKAVIIVSQSKMDFAGRLDHELERVKELEILVKEKEEELVLLRAENNDLQEKLKQDHQKDAVIHQLQDQARHYQVQYETVQRELQFLRNKLKAQHDMRTSPSTNSTDQRQGTEQPGSDNAETTSDSVSLGNDTDVNNQSSVLSENHKNERSGLDHEHFHQEEKHTDNHHHDCSSHDHGDHHHHHHDEHLHGHHDHDHSGEKHHHDHDHGEEAHHHHHDHGEEAHHHHNDHGEGGHHHNQHDDHHHHSHGSSGTVVARRGPSDELTELKKTLHRLEWENSSFRGEIDVLAVDAKQKRTYEEKCTSLEEENKRLRKEVEQLEHVIIQLQGENDTIGDYITLYQTQKMALKECAKEKDAQLEQLAREREMLLHRLAELTALVKDLKESKSEAGSQCADDHMHTLDTSFPSPHPPNKRQIEGKIRDLLTEISSSSLIENFHPCALCSGRLMTV